MSMYEYCPRGGMEGIATSVEEMVLLSQEVNDPYSDTYIPVPNIDMGEQAKRILEPHDHDLMDSDYWENDQGRHGWCCKYCGKVIQWG